MKKLTLAISIVSFALTVAAAPHSGERSHWMGRHDNVDNAVVPQGSVPDSTPTLALAILGIAALGLTGASLKRRDA